MKNTALARSFFKKFKNIARARAVKPQDSASIWTEKTEKAVRDTMKSILKKPGIQISKNVSKKKCEFWGIDCSWFSTNAWDTLPDDKDHKEDTAAIDIRLSAPIALVEIENKGAHWKILFCLWKLVFLSAPLRVLIAYPRGGHKNFIKTLEIVLKKSRNEMRKAPAGEILLILGKEDAESFLKANYAGYWMKAGRLTPREI